MRIRNLTVFPAHAGMNRLGRVRHSLFRCVPRARGDEPDGRFYILKLNVCSPRTRG